VNLTITTKVRCPYCGRNIKVNLDSLAPNETWIEDCKLCRKSMKFSSFHDEGKLRISAEKLD